MKPGMQGSNVCVCIGEGEFRGRRWAEENREEWEDQESEVGKGIVILKVLCWKCNGIDEKRVKSTKKQALGSSSVILTE